MNALTRGIAVAAAQMLLVASVGAKFLMDRSSYPRVWVETAPIDPDLPIRGRYVQLGVLVEAQRDNLAGMPGARELFYARLQVRNAKLIAVEDGDGAHLVSTVPCRENTCWRLAKPLAYFIPEHIEDPSRRPADEKLWVEVTVPPKGAPRPIQLGIRKDGKLTPLELR